MGALPKTEKSGDVHTPPRSEGRRYEAVLRLSEALSVCREPEDLTKILSEQLRDFLDFLQFYIIVYKENSTEVEWAVLGQEKSLVAAYADVPVEQRPSWQAFATQEPFQIVDWNTDERVPARLKQGIAAQGLDIGPLVFVPLTTPRRRLGAIGMSGHPGIVYDSDDVSFLRLIGRVLAFAIDDNFNFRQVEAAHAELQRQHQRLQRNERELREVVEKIPSMAWSAAADGTAEFFNRRWLDYAGLTADQAQGMGWTVALHPEDMHGLLEYWRGILATERPGEFEARLRRFDGEYRWFLFRATPAFDEDGKLHKWYGTNTDIEELKRVEQALRRSEAYLAESQRLTLTGSYATDGNTRQSIYWSEEMFRLWGFDPGQGLPTWDQWFERVHPEDRQKVKLAAERAFLEKVDSDTEFRILKPDGTVRVAHGIGHPVFSPNGDLFQVVGTLVDVTERRSAEEALRRSEKELRDAIDTIPAMVWTVLPDGSDVFVNKRWTEYVGLTATEASGSGWQAALHPEDLQEHLDKRHVSLISGEPLDVESRYRRAADGEYRWMLVRGVPFRDEHGHILRWYGTLTDIEDRKRAEAEIRGLKDQLYRENLALREEVDRASMFEEIVGTSDALRAVLSRIAKVAPTDSTVFVMGETGTGKELIARAVHKRSRRSGRAFVSVNCAALAPSLVSSELFGHEKGAFTGATQRRLGRFELADGGTIFLDEVGELPPDTQVALLRVLQEREFERVGGTQSIKVDVRVIAATNRDMKGAVDKGTFREDLFYRLNVFPIEVPPLRERRDDIPMLVEYFVERYAKRAGKNIRSIDRKTLDLLESYDWPGNIRELQNVIERSVILSSGDMLSVDDSSVSKRSSSRASQVKASEGEKRNGERWNERKIIEAALAESRGRVSGPSGAARKLRIPPSTLEHRIKVLRIDKSQFKFN